MKRLAILTTSLLLAITAGGTANAFADEGAETYYPENGEFIRTLDFPALTDYSINGSVYLFAENKTVSEYDGSNLVTYVFDKNISRLYCEDGISYCMTADGEVYSLPDKQPAEIEFPAENTPVNTDYYTYRLTGNKLAVADFSDPENLDIMTFEGEYSQLKQFGQAVYAISEHTLYEISGTEATPLSFEFFYNCVNAEGINIGNTSSYLKNYSLKFVIVSEGAYRTKVDLSDITGEQFKLGETDEAVETIALLLCYTGNAAIVAIGDDSYILNADNVQEISYNCFVTPDFENATVIGNRIYASPYVIIGTSAVDEATGTIVKILHKLDSEVLGSVYYEVEYTDGEGNTKTGYVADGFLTEYIIEDNKEPTKVTDPAYSEKTDTKTMLLIFAVVLLVLIAIGYLVYAGTSDKHKNKKNKKEEKKSDK